MFHCYTVLPVPSFDLTLSHLLYRSPVSEDSCSQSSLRARMLLSLPPACPRGGLPPRHLTGPLSCGLPSPSRDHWYVTTVLPSCLLPSCGQGPITGVRFLAGLMIAQGRRRWCQSLRAARCRPQTVPTCACRCPFAAPRAPSGAQVGTTQLCCSRAWESLPGVGTE